MEEIIETIFDRELNTFLHTTNEGYSKLILKYGLLLPENELDSLDATGKAGFTYWYGYRKVYGSHCVVIQLPVNYFDSEESEKDAEGIEDLKKILLNVDEEYFTEAFNDTEFKYLIPVKYIRGYLVDKVFYEKNK